MPIIRQIHNIVKVNQLHKIYKSKGLAVIIFLFNLLKYYIFILKLIHPIAFQTQEII